MAIAPLVLKVLVCPRCSSGLSLDYGSLLCTGCRARYPVKEDVPVMI